MILSWMRAIARRPGAPRGRRPQPQGKTRFRPRLECLEDRWVPANVNLTIAKAANLPTPGLFPGQSFTYTLTIQNVGTTATTSSPTVTDALPADLTLVSASSATTGVTVTHSGNTVNATLPAAFGAGAAATITITAVPIPTGTFPKMVTNIANLAVGAGDVNQGNNTASVMSTVSAPPNQLFVAQVYRDLLGREADTAGLTFWTGLLNQGQISRFQFVIDIESTLEYHTRVVTELYNRFLHRAPDQGGLSTWVNFLGNGGTQLQLETILLSSQEYFVTRGGGTNSGFIQALFQDVLKRPISSADLQVFLQAMANGFSRARIAQIVVTSPESATLEVQSLYNEFLHRPADQAGLNAWVNALLQNQAAANASASANANEANITTASTTTASTASGSTPRGFTLEEVTAGIVSSPEYFARLTS